jgi:hypothetical protein
LCGLNPAPTPSAPWQVTQSRSVWQLTQAFRFRSASNPWLPGFIGGSLQMLLGGWKRPLSLALVGLDSATPTRW